MYIDQSQFQWERMVGDSCQECCLKEARMDEVLSAFGKEFRVEKAD